jgi:hypothetical protein
MNKAVLLLVTLLLIPTYVHALDLPFFKGNDQKDEAAAKSEKKEKTTFIIHFKSGGTLPTDNYTVTPDNIVVMVPSGAIYLDKKMVKSIEEVAGPEEQTIQTIQIHSPAEPQKKTGNAGQGLNEPETQAPGQGPSAQMRDDEGHTEQWWKNKVDTWNNKKEDATKAYADAESDWNKYNGQLAGLDPDSTPQFELTRLQDLRGAARVAMDKAQADIDEADKMLNETLPDEARKAGAPPGWLR